jgi:hypothetical protein
MRHASIGLRHSAGSITIEIEAISCESRSKTRETRFNDFDRVILERNQKRHVPSSRKINDAGRTRSNKTPRWQGTQQGAPEARALAKSKPNTSYSHRSHHTLERTHFLEKLGASTLYSRKRIKSHLSLGLGAKEKRTQ